jgi:hypothetical protein
MISVEFPDLLVVLHTFVRSDPSHSNSRLEIALKYRGVYCRIGKLGCSLPLSGASLSGAYCSVIGRAFMREVPSMHLKASLKRMTIVVSRGSYARLWFIISM